MVLRAGLDSRGSLHLSFQKEATRKSCIGVSIVETVPMDVKNLLGQKYILASFKRIKK